MAVLASFLLAGCQGQELRLPWGPSAEEQVQQGREEVREDLGGVDPSWKQGDPLRSETVATNNVEGATETFGNTHYRPLMVQGRSEARARYPHEPLNHSFSDQSRLLQGLTDRVTAFARQYETGSDSAEVALNSANAYVRTHSQHTVEIEVQLRRKANGKWAAVLENGSDWESFPGGDSHSGMLLKNGNTYAYVNNAFWSQMVRAAVIAHLADGGGASGGSAVIYLPRVNRFH